MKNNTTDFISLINFIIDTLEKHTLTKPSDDSEDAVVEAYKALYILKDFFEDKD